MTVIILIGLPGSGKSTWAKIYCEKNTDYVRVCRDDLRRMRGKYWLPKDEDMITELEQNAIATALSFSKNVIVDATNLNKKYKDKLIAKIAQWDPTGDIIEKRFDLSPEECIKRDAKRGEASVGADVIWEMYYKHIAPPPVYKPSGPPCVICDLDGTLALNTSGRSPYDWKRVGEDKINTAVLDIICNEYAANGYLYEHDPHTRIFLMSGRDSVCRLDTIEWLRNNDVRYTELYMRALNDNRKDSIVKKELYEQHIAGQYSVKYVLDDRDQVVRMWRKELGLNVFQCNYGAF